MPWLLFPLNPFPKSQPGGSGSPAPPMAPLALCPTHGCASGTPSPLGFGSWSPSPRLPPGSSAPVWDADATPLPSPACLFGLHYHQGNISAAGKSEKRSVWSGGINAHGLIYSEMQSEGGRKPLRLLGKGEPGATLRRCAVATRGGLAAASSPSPSPSCGAGAAGSPPGPPALTRSPSG